MELTKSELEIMNVIWDAKRPLTRGEILDLSVDKKWKDNSIHILLNRLLERAPSLRAALQEAANLTAGSMSRTSPVWTSMRRMFFPAVIRRGEMLFDALLRRPDIDADMIKKFESKLKKEKRNSNKET